MAVAVLGNHCFDNQPVSFLLCIIKINAGFACTVSHDQIPIFTPIIISQDTSGTHNFGKQRLLWLSSIMLEIYAQLCGDITKNFSCDTTDCDSDNVGVESVKSQSQHSKNGNSQKLTIYRHRYRLPNRRKRRGGVYHNYGLLKLSAQRTQCSRLQVKINRRIFARFDFGRECCVFIVFLRNGFVCSAAVFIGAD